MVLSDESRNSFLKDEYLLLQNQYEDFDRRSLTIKGWFSDGAVAAIGLSFNAATSNSCFILVAVAVIAGVFWYLEAYWKMFQYDLSDRIRIIEAHFRNDPDILVKNPVPFQVFSSWFQSYAHDKPIYPYEQRQRPTRHGARLRRIAFQRFVCLPYAAFIALSLLAIAAIGLRP